MPNPRDIQEQEIRENRFLEPLTFIPEQVRKFFVNNVFQRTLSHLVGWTGEKSVMVACLSDGTLKVSSQATGQTTGKYNQVGVGTSATLVIASNTDRISLAVKNLGSSDMYIGFDSSVSSSNGWRVEPGAGVSFEYYLGPIYAVSPSGTQKMAYMEI